MSDVPSMADLSSGERVKCGARVDEGIYSAFREWVEEQTGNQYYEIGRALDRAMLEYMTDDEIQTVIDQTMKNEALLKKVLTKLDSEKVKEKATSEFEIPKGKDPGSRREREAYVIQAVLANDPEKVSMTALEQLIREVAGVSSDRTVRDYVEAITQTAAFQPSNVGNQWFFDPDGAREVLDSRGVPVPEGVTQ